MFVSLVLLIDVAFV